MPDILDFPQRFALLHQAWDLRAIPDRDFASAMGVDAGTVRRWRIGQTRNVDPRLDRDAAIAGLGKLLDAQALLGQRNVTEQDFCEALRSHDGMDLIRFFDRASMLDVPPCVREAAGQGTQAAEFARRALIKRGNSCRYLLYRLGKLDLTDIDTLGIDPKEARKVRFVVRRVPVLIETRQGSHYLAYRETYDTLNAVGALYHINQRFAIFGQDNDEKRQSNLFLISIEERPIAFGKFRGLYPGLILMVGDRDVATACKMLLRRVPDSLQQSTKADDTWESFAAALRRTVLLLDTNEDDAIDRICSLDQGIVVPDEQAEQVSDLRYEDYARELTIKQDIVDIDLRAYGR